MFDFEHDEDVYVHVQLVCPVGTTCGDEGESEKEKRRRKRKKNEQTERKRKRRREEILDI